MYDLVPDLEIEGGINIIQLFVNIFVYPFSPCCEPVPHISDLFLKWLSLPEKDRCGIPDDLVVKSRVSYLINIPVKHAALSKYLSENFVQNIPALTEQLLVFRLVSS